MPKPNLKCCICKKSIYRIPSRHNGRNTCSLSCRNKYYSGVKSFVYKHGKRRDPDKTRINDKLRRIAFKIKAVEFLGGKCTHCGYNKCIASLDFHHINPKTKDKDIKSIIGRSWENVKKELIKCVLLCSNCHRELHWKEDHGIKFQKEAKQYLLEYVPKNRRKPNEPRINTKIIKEIS